MPTPVNQYIGYQQVASTSAPKDVTSLNIPNGVIYAELQADTQAIRYRMDGGTPSSSVGMLLLTTEPPRKFNIEDLRRIKFIQGAGGAGNLNIHYYGST